MIELLMLLFVAYVGYVIGVNQSDWSRGWTIGRIVSTPTRHYRKVV